MRLVFVIYSLQAGGAERVLSIMANYWAGKSHKVILVTLEGERRPPFYEIDSRIQQVSLDVAGVSKNWFAGIINNLRRIYILRRVFHRAQADTIISFMTETNILSLMASYRLPTTVIVTEHTDPWTGPVADAWSKLRYRLYPRASRVVVLNQRAREFFDKSPCIRTTVMPNPIVIETEKEPVDLTSEVPSRHLIVAMGRLSQEKCFDLLIWAYRSVAIKYSDWNLIILGEGPEREALETLRDELGLGDRLLLPGTVKHPHVLLKKSDLFVSSSVLEGFPMALCEALACGLPVIATEYHSAIRDIVEDGQNGILVPPGDAGSLADAMIRLIENPQERKHLAENGAKLGERYSVAAVMKKWDQLLNEVVSEREVSV